jgi:hypothetical protein
MPLDPLWFKHYDFNSSQNVKPNNKYLLLVFDEDFVFEVQPTTLGRRTLEVILYDFDAYSRHHSIGGVKLPLAHIDLSEKVTLWKGLGPCSEQDARVSSIDLFVCSILDLSLYCFVSYFYCSTCFLVL